MLEAAPLMSTLRLLADVPKTLPPVAAPTTAPAGGAVQGLPPGLELPILSAWLAILLVVAAGVTVSAYYLGAFRRGVADGPTRIAGERPVWPTVAALFGGIFAYLGASAVAAVALGLVGPDGVDTAGPRYWVTAMQVSAAGYAGAVFVALALHALARRRGKAGPLGFGFDRLPPGLLVGVTALLVVLPWTFASGMAVQIVRFLLAFPTEATHPVLKAMHDNPDAATIIWGLVSSVVVAPLAEEILFRGFLQTSLVYGLPRLFGAGGTPPDDEPVPSAFATEGAMPVIPYATPVPPSGPSARWRWLGIALSATLFALLHPPWSWPIILILGLAFGYVYERTGSLYASITMHFVFNGMNVAMMLLML